MKCPVCGSEETSVDADLDSDDDFRIVREYRFCKVCGEEFDEEFNTDTDS